MRTPSTIARYGDPVAHQPGGMGTVYLAFDPQLERQVAVKVLRDDLDNDLARARFLREARAAAGLRHPNIVTIHDCGVHEGHPYLAMEYIPGDTLAAVLARRPPLSLARRLAIVEDLCRAVAHAHRRQIVHRDIKPGNVMIDADDVVKVLDFGLARTAESALTRDGLVVGTLSYMAPEQLAGARVDHRVDVFSTGAVLYELLALKPAFSGTLREGVMLRILHLGPEPLERVCPDLDPELCAVVARALARDPEARYQSLARSAPTSCGSAPASAASASARLRRATRQGPATCGTQTP